MAKFREIQDHKKIVDAVQLDQPVVYVHAHGEIQAKPGDWQIAHTDPLTGAVYIGLITAENFEKIYELLDIDDEVAHIAAEEMHAFDEAEKQEIQKVDRFIEECRSQRSQAGL